MLQLLLEDVKTSFPVLYILIAPSSKTLNHIASYILIIKEIDYTAKAVVISETGLKIFDTYGLGRFYDAYEFMPNQDCLQNVHDLQVL